MGSDSIKEQVNAWYQEYNNDIFQYVFLMIGDREQAKDILQDTFVRAFKKHDFFDGGNAKGWLFRIARNLTIDYIRRKKPVNYFFDNFPGIKSNGKGPEQIAILNETERLLFNSLNKIKRNYKDVIVLRKIKEFTILETAQILGWTENKVKVALFRGMKELKKELEKEGYNSETALWRSE